MRPIPAILFLVSFFFVVLSSSLASSSSAVPPYFLRLAGPIETVYDYANTCGFTPGGHPIDTDDSMPIAWRRADGQSVLVSAAGHGIHGLVGSDLNTLRHVCNHTVFNGTFDTTPQSFANYQWLQSVLAFPNGSYVGLAHNEFHGDHEGEPYCSGGSSSHCEVWSTGLTVSDDGGATFRLAASPPNHLVAAMPYRFEKDQPTSGYGAVSSMLPGKDGAFYGMINVLGLKDQQPGNCPFRTTNVFDRNAYRAWNGTHYSVHWADPYTSTTGGFCQPLPGYSSGSHPSLRRLVGLPDHWPDFIHLTIDGHLGGAGQCGYAFSSQDDFAAAITSWDNQNRTLDLGVGRYLAAGSSIQYTSLLDISSPALGVSAAGGDTRGTVEGNSYALFGNATGYLYFVMNRSIVKRRIIFSDQAPPPPPPPLPPAPGGCRTFNVAGAGQDDINGRYTMTNDTSDGSPVYAKDDAHQLYRYNSVWKLAQRFNSSAVHYVAQQQDTALPPPEEWRLFTAQSATPPAPEMVVCADDASRQRR